MLQVTQMGDDQENASPASLEASSSSQQARRIEPNPYLNSPYQDSLYPCDLVEVWKTSSQ